MGACGSGGRGWSGWPQQWLAQHLSDEPELRCFEATPLGGALCCDATLVSLLTRTGLPQPCDAAHDGAALQVAERRKRAAYPELNGGPQQLVVLGIEVGGRFNAGAHQLVRDLVRVRAQQAPPAVRSAGQALVRVGARHQPCPGVSLAGAPPREPTIGPRAGTRA